MKTRVYVAFTASGLGVLGIAALAGLPSVAFSAQHYEKGQVTVVIVESAALQNGVVKNSRGQILGDGTPRTKNATVPNARNGPIKSVKKTEPMIVIDLP
jgi:broad specificity polyphosphatase/5'/3'-nucleotidase SurE